MGNTYENEKGVNFEVHDDKKGTSHVNIYDKDPRDPSHESIHINWDSETGKGNIVEDNDSGKTTTDIGCYLTSACMKHFRETFDDNCHELTVLRWFRDNFVTQEDLKHYYKSAPLIVSTIDKSSDSDIIYSDIYENVIVACVDAIQKGDYDFAYSRYKNSIIRLEEKFAV